MAAPAPALQPCYFQFSLGSSKLESQSGRGKSRDRVAAEATGASHDRGRSTPSKVCRPGSEGGRVPFKFEDDNDWLVSDSHEVRTQIYPLCLSSLLIAHVFGYGTAELPDAPEL